MNQNTTDIVFMIVLVAMSGFFSATETAFSSFNKTRMKTLAEEGNKSATRVLKLSDAYDKLISTILIGNNIVNIGVAAVATMFFVRLCGETTGPTYATVIITIVVLIFGEVSPKSIAKDCPEKYVLFAAPIMVCLVWLFAPVNFFFSSWKKLLAKLLKVDNDSKMSQAELLMLVDEVEQDGSIDNQEGELLRNVIEFSDLRAEKILTPRVHLEAVSADSPKTEIAKRFSESKFSRLLVYKDTVDNIVGVLHLKDLYKGSGLTDKPLEDIMTEPIFVMRSAKISELLTQLQSNKSHIAVVLDEYGGTYGIVTLEDILEELVGDIWDEHDDIVENIRTIDETTYEADGTLELAEFEEFFDVDLESQSVTLSGWIMEKIGSIPEPEESFESDGLRITVLKVDNRMIECARIQRLQTEEENQQTNEEDPSQNDH